MADGRYFENNWREPETTTMTYDDPVVQDHQDLIDPQELGNRFKWADYLVFAIMLGLSAFIGVWFGFIKKSKKNSSDEFLMAGRSMGPFPVAMSLIASFMSAITLLGTPAEIYQYGTMYWLIAIPYIMTMLSAMYLYMPVFFRLQVTSAFEYLSLRFNQTTRSLGSGIFIVQMCLYMAIVVFAPALALSQVTGINRYLSVSLIFIVCIFYTTVGGMKAVIWTDTLQVIIMYAAMLGILFKEMGAAGGIAHVWEINKNHSRVEFLDFDPDPTKRHTVWTLIIGGYFTWIAVYGVNQAQVQRYLTVPTMNKARIGLLINLCGLLVLVSICCLLGMVIFARYKDCDPLSANFIDTSDQLFPLFVMDTLGTIPGLPGVFVAGIFSGALSTVSSGLNSLAAITYEDFVLGYFLKKENVSEEKGAWISKVLAVSYGIICFILVFVAEQLGDVLQAALSIFGMVGGPLLGLFTLGMFFPWATAKGAIWGVIGGMGFTFWVGFGAQVSKYYKQLENFKKDVSIGECERFNVNITALGINGTIISGENPEELAMGLYRVSYLYYSLIGCWAVILIGLAVSFMGNPQDPRKLNPLLIADISRHLCCCLPKPAKVFLRWNVGEDYKEEIIKPSKTEAHMEMHEEGEVKMRSIGTSNPMFAVVPDEIQTTNHVDSETKMGKVNPTFTLGGEDEKNHMSNTKL